jgi:hypothetical protein
MAAQALAHVVGQFWENVLLRVTKASKPVASAVSEISQNIDKSI